MAEVKPGSQEAQDKLMLEMGFPIPDDITQRTTQFINDYKFKQNLFGSGGNFEGKSAADVVNIIKEDDLVNGTTPEGEAALVAFEELADAEQNPPLMDYISDGFNKGWYGLTEGFRRGEQGVVDAIVNPMLDLAGIRITKDGVHVSQPKKLQIPDSVIEEGDHSRSRGKVSAYLLQQNLEGKGQPTRTKLPPESQREPLVKIPGQSEEVLKELEKSDTFQIYKGLAQAGTSYVIGDKVFAPAKALSVALPKLSTYIQTHAVKGVLNTAVGEGFTLEARDRFSTILRDTFGVDNVVINALAEAPDEDAFTARLKSMADGGMTAMGLGILVEPLLLIGRSFYNLGLFARKETNPERAKMLMDDALTFTNKLLEAVPQSKDGRFIPTKKTDPGFIGPAEIVRAKKPGKTSFEEGLEKIKNAGPAPKEVSLKDEVIQIIESGNASDKYVFHRSNVLDEIINDGLGVGGLSGSPAEDYGYGEFVHVFLKDDLPETLRNADLSDVSLFKEYKENIKPVGTFLADDLGDFSAYGTRAEELGDGPQPPYTPDPVEEQQVEVLNAGYRNKIDQLYNKKTQKPEEVILPTNANDPALTADDITPEDFLVYQSGKDVSFDSNIADINLERIDSFDSIKSLIQQMSEQIQNANEGNIRFGEPTRRVKDKKTGKWRTTGPVRSFEDIKKDAAQAILQLNEMGISPERFVRGLGSTTKNLDYMILAARDMVVSATSQIKKQAEAIAETYPPNQEQLARYQRNLVRWGNMVAEVRGVQKDIARSEAAMRIEALDGKERVALFEALIEDVATSREKGETRLIKLAEKMASMNSVNQLVNIARKGKIQTFFDAINYVGVANYLANLTTQTVNNIGSFAFLQMLTAEKYLQAGLNTIGVGKNGTTFDEANAYSFGITQAVMESLWLGIDDEVYQRSALGRASTGFKDLNTDFDATYDIGANPQPSGNTFMSLAAPDPFNADAAERLVGANPGDFHNWFRSAINGLGVTLGMPLRLLGGGDNFFKAMSYRAQIHALAMKRAVEEGLHGHARHKRYLEIVKNLPEDIDTEAHLYSKMATFQTKLDPKHPVEGLFKKVEDIRKPLKPDPDRNPAIEFLAAGSKSFILAKIPFMRSPYNIGKEMLVKRNLPIVMSRLGIDKQYRKRFLNDAEFTQDVVAKSLTGSTLLWMGYSLGGGEMNLGFIDAPSTKDFFTPEGYDISITGGASPSGSERGLYSTSRDVAQDQLRQPPDILIRNMQTMDATSIPIGRGSPISDLIIVGSIIGNLEAFHKAHIAPFEESGDYQNAKLANEQWWDQLKFQAGGLFTDKAMLRGIQEILNNTIGPYADPTKLGTDYIAKFAAQPPLANFLRGIKAGYSNQKTYQEGDIKETYVPKSETDINVSTTGYEYPNITPKKVEAISAWKLIAQRTIDEWRKVNILDMDPQSKDPIIRPGAIPMVDLEGNAIGFNDREAGIYERFLEKNLIPFSARKVNETNTSVLIDKFNININHPKRWRHLRVGDEKIPLTSEQMMIVAAKYGLYNRQAFKRYNKLVKELKRDANQYAKNNPQLYNNMRMAIKKELMQHKERATAEMIAMYPDLYRKQQELQVKNDLEIN